VRHFLEGSGVPVVAAKVHLRQQYAAAPAPISSARATFTFALHTGQAHTLPHSIDPVKCASRPPSSSRTPTRSSCSSQAATIDHSTRRSS
jgi:hypothetical protein